MRLLGIAAGLIVLFVAAATVLAGRDVLAARQATDRAVAAAGRAGRSALDGDFAVAQRDLVNTAAYLDEARADLDTTWSRIAGRVPLLGPNVQAFRAGIDAGWHLMAAGDDLLSFLNADRPPLFSAQRFDPVALALLADALASASTHTAAARGSLGTVSRATIAVSKEDLSLADTASRRLNDALIGADALTRRLQAAASGSDPFRVLILFENGAEMRATGGLFGFFSVLTVDDGGVSLSRIGPIGDLYARDANGQLVSVRAPADYVTRYGHYLATTALWSNVNLSPHYPWVAAVAADLYAAATDEQADLVVRMDLTGAGELLAAMPPEVLAQVPFDPSTLATDFVLDSYVRFPDNEDQSAYLATVVGAVLARILTTPQIDTQAVLSALSDMVQERHMAVFSPDPDIEGALASAGADGSLQPGDPGQVDVVVQNFGGNKLDLFTQTAIAVDLEPTGCVMLGTITTTITNAATGQADQLPNTGLGAVGRWWVNTYLPTGATVLQILVDGEATAGSVQSELGRPVAAKIVQIAPDESVSVTVRWQETITERSYRLRMQPQPLVHPATLSVSGFDDRVFTRTEGFDVATGCVNP